MSYSLDWLYPWLSKSQFAPHADPFDDYSSRAIPHEFYHALRWCQDIVLRDGVYRSAINKVVSYFVGDIKIENVSKRNAKKYQEFLNDALNLPHVLRIIGMDYMIYGNSFISILKKFKRNLYCNKCNIEFSIKNLNYDVQLSIIDRDTVSVVCSNCGASGPKKIIDHEDNSDSAFYIKRWNPFNIIIRSHVITGDCEYILILDRELRRQADLDTLFFIKYAPKIIIEAVKKDKDLVFREDFMLHLKEEAPSGLLLRGWGLSPVLSNLKHSWYLQVLRRYNEAMGLDYIIPLRFITPVAAPGTPDPLHVTDMSWLQAIMVDMLRWRRIDPTAWFIMPYPVQLVAQEPGNRQFATIQLIEQAHNILLNSIGVPVEFYNMNFQVQAAPTSLRLMENTFSGLRTVLNKATKWIVYKVANSLDWEDLTVSLPRPTTIDDINKQLAKVQLMTNGIISRTTGLDALGLSFEEEQKKMLEEEEYLTKEIVKAKQEMTNFQVGEMLSYPSTVSGMLEKSIQEQAMAASGALGLGQPAPSGPLQMPPVVQGGVASGDPISQFLANVPAPGAQKISYDELEQMADSLARQLLDPNMDPTLRNSILRRIKEKNKTIHALIVQKIKEMRYAAKVSQQAQIM